MPLTGRRSTGFSLLELLVVVAIIALLMGIALPAMSGARREGRLAACGARLRELGSALHMYGNDYDGRLMPLAYWSYEIIGDGPVVYWWGTNDATTVDFQRGFVAPYLQSPLGDGTVFECPEQPWGGYTPQGAAAGRTSTYGYNGYYLSPPHTPGWAFTIGHRPWLDFGKVRDPSRVFAFADAAIDLGEDLPRNTALLDPPLLYSDNGAWSSNGNPTTSFRHTGRTQAAHVDGHVDRYRAQPDWLTSTRFAIGSVTRTNAPHYVPDWNNWTGP